MNRLERSAHPSDPENPGEIIKPMSVIIVTDGGE